MNCKFLYKFGAIALTGTLLTGCGQVTEKKEKESKQEIPSKSVEDKASFKNKNLKKSDLKGNYIFISENRRSAVKIDEKLIRFSDGKKNYRYRIIDKENRIVLSNKKNSDVYITKTNGKSIRLVGIDKNGKSNGKHITLEKTN